jgi:hypothetical protein
MYYLHAIKEVYKYVWTHTYIFLHEQENHECFLPCFFPLTSVSWRSFYINKKELSYYFNYLIINYEGIIANGNICVLAAGISSFIIACQCSLNIFWIVVLIVLLLMMICKSLL